MTCAGWGVDLARSVALAQELGVAERVTFLPHAMSKTRLLRYFRAADVVIDQVAIGSYGTSALEAMSCGTPLIINLDRERFARAFPTHPPVAQAETADDVAGRLRELGRASPEARAAFGAGERAWVVQHHGDRLVDELLALCERAAGRAPGR
jgi:glycosyltransferase involved in cell wall biosynthesis